MVKWKGYYFEKFIEVEVEVDETSRGHLAQ